MVKPCRRKAARNWFMATVGDTGFSVTSVIVPLTRGSTTTLAPEMVAMVRATASMSALLKFKVIGSPRLATPSVRVCASEFKGNRVLAPVSSAATAIKIIVLLPNCAGEVGVRNLIGFSPR